MKSERIEIQIRGSATKRLRDAPTAEIARMLRKLADDFERHGGPATRRNGRHDVAGLFDSAGRTCGCVMIEAAT